MARNPNRARHHEWHAPDGKVYELVDLPHQNTLIVSPSAEDVQNACPTNPNECVLAQWAKRNSGGAPAQIGVDKAYIPMVINGTLIMYRCKVPRPTLDAINQFDRTGEFPLGGFLFKGIPPAETIDSKRSADKRRRERWGNARDVSSNRKPRKLHLRNAARKAQVFVREEAA